MEAIDKNEYISKIEVVRILQKAYADGRIQAKDGCVSLLDDINALPAADVQPVKRGHWIETNHGIYCDYECSECGNIRDYRHNFCENCGADMRGDTE